MFDSSRCSRITWFKDFINLASLLFNDVCIRLTSFSKHSSVCTRISLENDVFAGMVVIPVDKSSELSFCAFHEPSRSSGMVELPEL